jgi:hypothetical protein
MSGTVASWDMDQLVDLCFQEELTDRLAAASHQLAQRTECPVPPVIEKLGESNSLQGHVIKSASEEQVDSVPVLLVDFGLIECGDRHHGDCIPDQRLETVTEAAVQHSHSYLDQTVEHFTSDLWQSDGCVPAPSSLSSWSTGSCAASESVGSVASVGETINLSEEQLVSLTSSSDVNNSEEESISVSSNYLPSMFAEEQLVVGSSNLGVASYVDGQLNTEDLYRDYSSWVEERLSSGDGPPVATSADIFDASSDTVSDADILRLLSDVPMPYSDDEMSTGDLALLLHPCLSEETKPEENSNDCVKSGGDEARCKERPTIAPGRGRQAGKAAMGGRQAGEAAMGGRQAGKAAMGGRQAGEGRSKKADGGQGERPARRRREYPISLGIAKNKVIVLVCALKRMDSF